MDGQQQEPQGFDEVVPPLDVGALVAQHVLPLPGLQPEGDVDLRPEKPQHKGGTERPALVHVVGEFHRRGHLPLHPQVGDQRPDQ